MPQYPNYLNYAPMPPMQQNYIAPTIVNIRSEGEARNYPVGLGNMVIFKNVNQPYIYCKTMGFSQLDSPLFEIYKRVDSETPDIQPEQTKAEEIPQYALKSDLEPILEQIQAIQEEIKKTVKQTKTVKKEATDE